MEPKHPRHYGPAREAFANDATKHQQNHSGKSKSASGHTTDHHDEDVQTESIDLVSRYDGTDTSDSRADAIAAFILVLCVVAGMLLWVSTR